MIIDFEGKKLQIAYDEGVKIINSPNSIEMEFEVLLTLVVTMYAYYNDISKLEAEKGLIKVLARSVSEKTGEKVEVSYDKSL